MLGRIVIDVIVCEDLYVCICCVSLYFDVDCDVCE